MKQNNIKITFAGNPMPLSGQEIKIGDKAPDFTTVGNDLKPVNFSDYKGKIRIISVFPSLDTGVCALQNKRFNQEAAENKDIEIISVSVDLPFAQKRFCGAEGIDAAVTVSDHKDLDFGIKYGFVMEPLRLLARGVIVVDKDDTVKHVEYVSEVTTEPDYEAALKVAKELT
ncbi:MAG: thiol peroxidase [Bacteroidales bacterium]|nr:thiol peroxidase [Bacteroidales bacterium]